MLRMDNLSTNRATSQGTYGLKGKRSANTRTNLLDVRNLRNKGRTKRDETTGREAKNDHKDQNTGNGRNGDPNRQTKQPGDECNGNHDIVSSKPISSHAGQDTAQDADGVEDGQEILDKVRRHACRLGLEQDVVEGEEHSPDEEEDAENGEDHGYFAQTVGVFLEDEWTGARWQSGFDSEAGDGEETEEHEGDGAHHPGETDAVDEFVHHDWEDDTAD